MPVRFPSPASPQGLPLLAAPAAALGLAAWASWVPGEAGRALTAATAALGGASAVLALAFALDAARVRRAFAHLRRGKGALAWVPPERVERRARQHHEAVAQLRRQVEQLSAIRDLALIANDDTSLERIFERAMHVLRGLLDPREIVIYRVEGPEQDRLVPVAVASGDRTRVAPDGSLPATPREALRALEDRRTIVEPSPGGARAAALLVADGEVMGALEVRLAAGSERDPRELTRELEALAKHIALALRKPALYDRAVLDALTGLHTKRHFVERMAQLMAQGARLGAPLSLILVDIDRFKQVNDVHGHVAGDAVLAEVARRVRATVRAYDEAFRYGGEELVVVAPETDLDAAVALAERLRRDIRGAPVALPQGEVAGIPVTASFGVATYDPDAHPTLEAFIAAADQHLYAAKHGGRDQVRSARSPAPEAVEAAGPAPAPAPTAEAAFGAAPPRPAAKRRAPRRRVGAAAGDADAASGAAAPDALAA